MNFESPASDVLEKIEKGISQLIPIIIKKPCIPKIIVLSDEDYYLIRRCQINNNIENDFADRIITYDGIPVYKESDVLKIV